MKIAIIGAGKIGLAIGELAESVSCEVFYIDIKSPYSEDYAKIHGSDLIFIAVNTTTSDGYDTSNIDDCVSKIKQNKIKSEIVILSTCPPSYFESKNNDLTYSPLFIRQGTIIEDIINADFVLVGSNNSNKLIKFYSLIRKDYEFILLSNHEVATVKMAINGFLCLKVSYANMIGDFCIKMGNDANKVVETISKCKSINSNYFKYGYGYGGPCLPIDNKTLSKEIDNDFPSRVDDENKKHLEFQIKQFVNNNKKDKEYVFEKISYKKDLSIIENSQKLEMALRLSKMGYKIKIIDSPGVCELIKQKHPNSFLYE